MCRGGFSRSSARNPIDYLAHTIAAIFRARTEPQERAIPMTRAMATRYRRLLALAAVGPIPAFPASRRPTAVRRERIALGRGAPGCGREGGWCSEPSGRGARRHTSRTCGLVREVAVKVGARTGR